jgi:hypothetical protein
VCAASLRQNRVFVAVALALAALAALAGGDLLYLAPGVSASLGAGFSAYAFVQFPVFQDVSGVQLTPEQIYSVGFRKTF